MKFFLKRLSAFELNVLKKLNCLRIKNIVTIIFIILEKNSTRSCVIFEKNVQYLIYKSMVLIDNKKIHRYMIWLPVNWLKFFKFLVMFKKFILQINKIIKICKKLFYSLFSFLIEKFLYFLRNLIDLKRLYMISIGIKFKIKY